MLVLVSSYPLTQQDLQQITSVAIQYFKRNTFPAIPWSIWTAAKPSGGLGVLDPKSQYLALFFRWIQPLLLDNFPNHRLTQMLKLHINNRNSSRHYLIPLLFPATRSSGLPKGRTSTIDILYAALDCIPRNFESVIITPSTALALPLQAFFSSPRLPKKSPQAIW
jgi:hypothetical protein